MRLMDDAEDTMTEARDMMVIANRKGKELEEAKVSCISSEGTHSDS